MLSVIREMRERPSDAVVLSICAAVVVAMQASHWTWFIDDSAIVFSYARSVVQGEGVVPWPGAERVEAFSDPTWLLLLTIAQAVGLDGFTVAKPLAMGLSVATLPVVWRTAKLALPNHAGPGALIAPITLALNAQFAIWGASGLENSLFCLLLALAIHRTLVEGRSGGFPWASVFYLLLAWTRPEGVLYAAVGGLLFAVWSSKRGLREIGTWLAIFCIPTLILEMMRIWYFAWPLPNTYYAKVESRGAYPLSWNHRGWTHIRDYAGRLWQGWFMPVYVLALSGTVGRRAKVALGVVAVLGLSLLWPGPDKLRALWFWPTLPAPPEVVLQARVLALYGAAVLLPLVAVGVPGVRARTLCWHSVVGGLFFGIYANGDWMGAYRWMSLVAPPASVLLATGWTEVFDALQRRVSGTPAWQGTGWIAASIGVGLLLPPNLSQMRDHLYWNRNETPEMVKLRADYTRQIARRAFHEGAIVNLDMDMGAHLWWAPDYVQIDMAMLVDVPMGRHWPYQQRAFLDDHVFGEHEPTFAHVHGWWAKHSGLKLHPRWHDWYFELPPYEDLEGMPPHNGVWARRSLVMAPGVPHEGRRVPFADGVVLEHWDQPVTWGVGGHGYLEARFSSRTRTVAEGDIRVVAFLSRASEDRVVSWELPMGYGIHPMHDWTPGRVFRGRHAVALPADLSTGTWDLGFFLTDARGRPLSPAVADLPPTAVVGDEDSARYAVGEVRFPGALEVVSADALGALAEQTVGAVIGASVDCDGAEASWLAARRLRPMDLAWEAEREPAVSRALADCLARAAEGDASDAPALLARAHAWDHRSPELARVGAQVGERLWTEGLAAREQGAWQRAYDRFSALLRFQPWRSWARRYAEEARDHRLGLTDFERVGNGGDDAVRSPSAPDVVP